MKILDCTIRDGGYYTNWDFNKTIVDEYVKGMNELPVDYLEVGYRSIPMKGYLGKYFYCPVYELEDLKAKSNKKLVIILNEKDIRVEHLAELLVPIVGLVDMVRIALDPQNLNRAIVLAEGIKKYGFEVGFNVMYMSKWSEYDGFIQNLKYIDGVADYFYMVDSYGGVYPQDIINTIELLKENTKCSIGFHGHNNLELALINTLTAIELGAEIVDSTILGMGRGAGNLKTELLLSVLNSKFSYKVNFNALGNIVNEFGGLMEKHGWGTNLPYMISGSNSLPQKDVMDWLSTRFYSFNAIIGALENQKNKITDNQKLPVFAPQKKYKKAIIVGGGKNTLEHAKAIQELISKDESTCVIHASSKNAIAFKSILADQYFCLIGNEGNRLEEVFKEWKDFNGVCVLPPFPRKMGTYVPNEIVNKCFQLSEIVFNDKVTDSHTVLALQVALLLGSEEVFVAGYDGYGSSSISEVERILINENEYVFDKYQNFTGQKLIAITPTEYSSLHKESIYSFI